MKLQQHGRSIGGVSVASSLEKRHLPVAASRVAEYESWRKELHRPATYVHKWWARRLGSVLRSVLIAAARTGGKRSGSPTGRGGRVRSVRRFGHDARGSGEARGASRLP